MQTAHTNGFSGKTIDELIALFDANKRPGRRSKEQQALADLIEHMENNNLDRVPAKGFQFPTSTADGGIEPETSKPEKGRKAKEELDGPIVKPSKVKRGKASDGDMVMVPPIATNLLTVTVEGTEMLITHAWDTKSKRQIEEKQQGKAHKGRAARDPEAEFHAARYLDAQGRDCVPALCFKNAMVGTASYLANVTKTLIRGAIYVKGDKLPILDKRGKPMKPEMRSDMVRIGGMSKTADIRYRPCYPAGWRIKLDIEFDNQQFTPEQVINLLNRSGFHVGICEWRPTYGRYRVISS